MRAGDDWRMAWAVGLRPRLQGRGGVTSHGGDLPGRACFTTCWQQEARCPLCGRASVEEGQGRPRFVAPHPIYPFLVACLVVTFTFSCFLTLVCCQQLQRMLSPTQTPWRSIPRNALLRRPRQPYLEMGTRTHPPPRKDHLKQRRTRTTPTWRDCRALLRQLPQTQTWSRFPPWIVL